MGVANVIPKMELKALREEADPPPSRTAQHSLKTSCTSLRGDALGSALSSKGATHIGSLAPRRTLTQR